MTLPARHTAGDTLTFTESHADYLPEDGWVLSYVLVSALGKITLTTTDNGDGTHLINETAATTKNWLADLYRWQRYFTKGTERFTDGRGALEVLADFASVVSTLDARSDWQQILDSLKAAYKTLASTSATVATVSYKDRSTTYRSIEEVLTALNHAERQVALEKKQQALRDGYPTGNKINFRA